MKVAKAKKRIEQIEHDRMAGKISPKMAAAKTARITKALIRRCDELERYLSKAGPGVHAWVQLEKLEARVKERQLQEHIEQLTQGLRRLVDLAEVAAAARLPAWHDRAFDELFTAAEQQRPLLEDEG